MAQKRLMLQSLLAERFGLILVHKTRELSGYALIVAKGGPKIETAKSEELNMMLGRSPAGLRSLTARNAPMDSIAKMFGDILDRPVSNSTGLTGLYDFKMEWMPDVGETPLGLKGNAPQEPAASAALDGPSIFSAVQEQLGLKLEARKVSAEVTVVESAQKPALD